MTFDPATVDRIVSDVLSAMTPPRTETAAKRGAIPAKVAAPSFDRDLRHAAVLTGEMLDGLDAGATVAVAKKHVLTPSARDAVRTRSLTLRAEAKAASNTKSVRTALRIVRSTPLTRRLAERLGWPCDYPGCDGDAVADARSMVCRGDADFVAVVAAGPHRTAMRLNRTRGVSAVAVSPQTPLEAILAEGEWNVACLSAEGWSPFALTRAVERLAGGVQ